MRALGSGSLVLAACCLSGVAWAAPSAPAGSEPPVAADPVPPAPAPPPPPEPPAPAPPPPAPSAPIAPAAEPPAPVPPESPVIAPPAESAPPARSLPGPERVAARVTVPPAPRNEDALPLSLEARFGFNARFGSSFDASADDEVLDTSFGLGGYVSWQPEYAVGLELEHSGLGRVRALSGENSVDAEYSATSGWLAARVFPWRSERLDLFLNLRLGLAFQHLDALGTRKETSAITVPATSFSCSAWDGPGIGLGAAFGLSYRFARHVAFVTRVDGTGERLSGDELGTCADGIGSVTIVSGTVGLAYEFEAAKR